MAIQQGHESAFGGRERTAGPRRPAPMLQAALADVGIAFAIEEEVAEHLAAGRLERVLADWCAPFPGFHLDHPNRRNHPAALSAVIDLLRYPGEEHPGPA